MRCLSIWCLVWMIFCHPHLQAQYYNQLPAFLNTNSKWVFGKNVGMNFSVSPPASFHSQINSDEGCASVADPVTGELLFYAGDTFCWNRYNMLMPNGKGIKGNAHRGTTAQGTCIVPFVDSPGKYYLFSLSNDGSYDSTGYLYYSVVDMSLAGGMGDIDPNRKNILIDSGLTEAMIAVPGNNCDIWLMVHTFDDPIFKAYHITSAGLNTTPVLSSVGAQISGREAYHIGQMAVSPARDMIAITSYHYHYGIFHGNPYPPPGLKLIGALVAKFDPSTGTVSDAIQVEHQACYGIGFSPDNTKLYVNIAFDPAISLGKVNQYDLSVFDSASISSTRQEIHRFDNPIGKEVSFKTYKDTIYVGGLFNYNALDRISQPNLSGTACNYEANIVRYAPSGSVRSNYGLPNDVVLQSSPDTLYVRHDSVLCDNQQTVTLVAPVGMSDYLWDDQTQSSEREVNRVGTYWVQYRNGCNLRVDTFVVYLPDTSFVTSDSFICVEGKELQLQAPNGFESYTWDDGSVGSRRPVVAPGMYWVASYNSCHRQLDSFYVHDADISFSLGGDTTICDGSPLRIELEFEGASFIWQDGSTDPYFTIEESGIYSLVVEKGSCLFADSIYVQYADVTQDLGADTLVCLHRPLEMKLLAAANNNSEIIWSNGSTEPMLDVYQPGLYWVMVKEGGCIGADSILVDSVLCDCEVSMPNAFTPNQDGKNDYFRAVLEEGCEVAGYYLEVYNRWGEKVFVGTDFSEGWDGNVGGQPAEVGTYFYKISLEVGREKRLFQRKGDLTLIR